MTCFALRYDVSPYVGLGHLRRAFALAAELSNRGIAHCHVVTDEGRNVALREGADPAHILLADGVGTDWLREKPQVTHVLTDISRTGNSHPASSEISALAATPPVIGVIDSMPPDHFVSIGPDVPDIVFTPYLNADRFRDRPDARRWCHGARYAVLSPEYTNGDAHDWDSGRVLVTCGGSDPDDLTIRVAIRLAAIDQPADIIVGPLFTEGQKARLGKLAQAHDFLHLHDAPSGLAPYIRASVFVIGRLGLTRYEAAILGRSGLYLSAGTSYREYLKGFEDAGLAQIFFDGDSDGTARFLDAISDLADPAVRNRLFRPNTKALALVDGKGAANMIEEMLTMPPKGTK